MPKTVKKTKKQGIPIREANEVITGLRQQLDPIHSETEDFDQPLDSDIVVTRGKREEHVTSPYHRMQLIVEGKAVSWLTVVDFQQQIGSQTLRMGGIAGVDTHNDHRFKGYGRRLINNLFRWLYREEYDTTLLYGVLNYYPRYGYAPAFPALQFTMTVRDAREAQPRGFTFVDFYPDYIKPVLRLYHQTNRTRTGPTRRYSRYWDGFQHGIFKGPPKSCKVILNPKGKPVGYLTYDVSGGHHAFELQMGMSMMEIGYSTSAVFPDILHQAARIASENDLDSFTLLLPEDLEFIDYCKVYGIRKSLFYRKDGGGLVRMVNIPSALKKVSRELGSRMSDRGQFNLGTNLQNVSLSWSKGELRVSSPIPGIPWVRMPQWAFAQLLYGSRNPKVLYDLGILKASGKTRAILEEMFPERPHYHYELDHF